MSSPPIKEVLLEEIELHSSLLEEGLSCLLHTIIFVRHPGSVRPVDFSCTQLAPLTFAKCGLPNADTRVKSAIDNLQANLVYVGPKLYRGILTLSYFEMRETKTLFGFISSAEKTYFEKWSIPVLINEIPLRRTTDETGEIERERVKDCCRATIHMRLMSIFQIANGEVEHIPSTFDYEISPLHSANNSPQFNNVPAGAAIQGQHRSHRNSI